jgi:hypothetical protein
MPGDDGCATAVQQVLHEAGHPSAVLLPIPEEAT